MAAIAAFAWTEARRTRLPWVALGTCGLLVAVSAFFRSLAVIEGARLQLSFLAPAIRISAIVLVCLHTIGSLLREQQDKGTELLLSLDLARAEYLLGKLAGYMLVAAGVCVVLWLPLPFHASVVPSLCWLLSLILEAWIVVAAAVFCAITFNQMLLGVAFVLAFYVLSRAMPAIVLIATASPFVEPTWTHAILAASVRAAALGLPPLDRFTSTQWLIGQGPPLTVLVSLAASAFVYAALLSTAALVDLYRRNF